MILLTDRIQVSENMRMAVIVGFLGAFTTFSTFEMEIYVLIKEKFLAMAFVYFFLSVFVGFIGILGGVWLARKF